MKLRLIKKELGELMGLCKHSQKELDKICLIIDLIFKKEQTQTQEVEK